MAYVKIIELARCRENGGTFVECGSRELAVFLTGESGTPVVIDNACPHASGNLSGGAIEGTVVTCPWHQWRFDLTTGACVHSDLARVARYPAELRDGEIHADLDTPY